MLNFHITSFEGLFLDNRPWSFVRNVPLVVESRGSFKFQFGKGRKGDKEDERRDVRYWRASQQQVQSLRDESHLCQSEGYLFNYSLGACFKREQGKREHTRTRKEWIVLNYSWWITDLCSPPHYSLGVCGNPAVIELAIWGFHIHLLLCGPLEPRWSQQRSNFYLFKSKNCWYWPNTLLLNGFWTVETICRSF